MMDIRRSRTWRPPIEELETLLAIGDVWWFRAVDGLVVGCVDARSASWRDDCARAYRQLDEQNKLRSEELWCIVLFVSVSIEDGSADDILRRVEADTRGSEKVAFRKGDTPRAFSGPLLSQRTGSKEGVPLHRDLLFHFVQELEPLLADKIRAALFGSKRRDVMSLIDALKSDR